MIAVIATQRMDQAEAVRQILIGSGVLIVAVLVGFAILYWVRRRLTGDASQAGDHGFTLHDLRTLHERGDLTDDEFNRAREAMISRVRGSDDTDDDTDENSDDRPPGMPPPRSGPGGPVDESGTSGGPSCGTSG